ncbi:MAG: alpha/beta hydrolase [Alphaproteobacteria bacterium]|nr:MAG: alpha/beta hydrolase [Alphaproteobacteria bacterium]
MQRPRPGRRWFLVGVASVAIWNLARRPAASEDATLIEEDWSEGHLAGTLARPAQVTKRGPAALIISGSGPTPRDGNYDTYKLIARGLAAAGIRSLRYDKRGVGKSRALVVREDDLIVQTFADDVVLAAASLAKRDDVSSLILVGHSEGALLAILAAKRTPIAGIVLLACAGRRLDVLMREQIAAIPLPADQEHSRAESYAILDRLAHGERVTDMSAEQAKLFRPSVQPFLISAFAIDPAAELAKLETPVLIVWGESDIQVRRSDFDALVAARPDARTLILPATNHMFKPAPREIADRAAQLQSYDRAAPLTPDLIPGIVDFIGGRIRPAGQNHAQ